MEDFGMGDLDEQQAAPPQTHQREHVTEGVHEFQIVRVTNKDYGCDLALQHDDKRYGWVWHRLDRQHSQTAYRCRELRDALDMSLDEWRGMDMTELVGRRVRAEIRHKVASDGWLWVNVWKYMPIAELEQPATPAPPQAARTPAAKVKRASPAIAADADDIPF